MKASIILFIVFVSSITYVTGQADRVFVNSYLYQDTVFFVDTLVREQRGLKADKITFHEIKPKEALTFENDSLKKIVLLAEDKNLFFINSSKTDINIVHKLSAIRIDSFGSRMFPDNIRKIDLDQDKIEELLLRYTEAEEPPALFKIAILEFGSMQPEVLIETKPLFPFPSYNPFIEPEDISIEKSRIIIPYCVGCESGKEGREAKGAIRYQDGTYVFEE